ncbi:MAG: DUF4293 domain-containing protein [Prevotellaceae bacterium]|jgi:hypothetical protein|nr:DUF4293 domain-containing protein [Prevotellaceae bacterium]
MLQRKQTIYLLIITVLGGLACYSYKLIDFSTGLIGRGGLALSEWNNDCIVLFSVENIIFNFTSSLIPIFAFIAIWLFKKRKIQIKFVWVVFFLIIINYISIIWLLFAVGIDFHTIKIYIPLIFNLINLIFCILAIKAIKKDEDLVRSLDRIR